MKILAIETSCDETSIALIEKNVEGYYKVLSHQTISQINLHREFGGVYPTLSRREHEKNLVPLLHKVLSDSKMLVKTDFLHEKIIEVLGPDIELLERYPDLKENVFDFFSKFKVGNETGGIDFLAVTNGPGLPPALWVGVNFTKILSILLGDKDKLPVYPINHMEGHIIGAISKNSENQVLISKINYPTVSLLISGGHTELVLSSKNGDYKKIGETQDDAVGEAYDKVARLLGLPYPGGPEIANLSEKFRQNASSISMEKFPRPMIHSSDLNFSFSGLKTHILYLVQKLRAESLKDQLTDEQKTEIAFQFEEAVKDVLVYKTKKAIGENNAKTLVVGGGVASNTCLKICFQELANDLDIDIFISSRELSTDNALMIALCAANRIENNVLPSKDFGAVGSKNYEWK